MSFKIKELRNFSLSAIFGFLCTWATLHAVDWMNRSATRQPSSSSLIWNLRDLPSEAAVEREDFKATAPTSGPTPTHLIDRRANLLVDLYANPSDTKMNGYGGFLTYRTQANKTDIDRLIYCHNLEETSTSARVNFERNRFIVDHVRGYACIGLRLEELSEGLKLIELPGGTPGIMIRTSPDFSHKTGGKLELIYLAQKGLTKTDLRQIDVRIVRKGPGRFTLETPSQTPFNRLTFDVRSSQFWSFGLPTGITRIELSSAPTTSQASARKVVSTIDSVELRRVRE